MTNKASSPLRIPKRSEGKLLELVPLHSKEAGLELSKAMTVARLIDLDYERRQPPQAQLKDDFESGSVLGQFANYKPGESGTDTVVSQRGAVTKK